MATKKPHDERPNHGKKVTDSPTHEPPLVTPKNDGTFIRAGKKARNR